MIFHVHTTNPNEAEADLTPLLGLKNLKRLELFYVPVSDDQQAMLKKALPNCKIWFRYEYKKKF